MKFATVLFLMLLTALALNLITHALNRRQCRKLYEKAVKEGVEEEFLRLVNYYVYKANRVPSTKMDVLYRIALSDALHSKMKQAGDE
ncbi:hypothetical protein P0I46_004402 [Salmonella enterica]|nr:hypothetical protein [Salmonella enterica]EEM8220504.1 hypothetical protein [Salmonella enterica subsp. enterica serovar Heidelberg]EEY3383053.1 hypothetical protein [Escherichia coli]EDS3243375.1 hypothetical protein [Salmonella enterica]EFR9444042.1 hypothetical protein [Salmonella enterica]